MTSNRRLVALFLAVVGFTFSTQATEFGNVFGSPEIENASRQASARALLALEQMIGAIRQRELKEGSGLEELGKAGADLKTASAEMRAIVDGKFGPLPDVGLQSSDYQGHEDQLRSVNERFGLSSAENLAGLYGNFGSATDILGDYLIKIASTPTEEPVFPNISSILADYVSLADATTVVARSVNIRTPK